MDLQTRKKSFVREFLTINDEKIIMCLEKELKKEKNLLIKAKSFETLNNEIDTALNDVKNGRLIEVFDLKEKVKNW